MKDHTIITPVWDGEEWTYEIDLPAWRPFLHQHTADRIDAVFLLDDEHQDASPSPAQISTLAHFIAMQQEFCLIVEAAMRRYYDNMRPKYVAFALRVPDFMGDATMNMPENPDPSTFARLHKLNGLFVHSVVASGLAYVGLSFQASWDPEHGAGVMAHDRRVVDVGGADTAFLSWIAKKDAER